MMYQCIKQYGSIKTGSFWNVDRYIVNSDGKRRKVIIANEDNWLLLSMADFENHFAEANETLTEQEYLQTSNTKQLAETIHQLIDGGLCGLCRWDCRERCIVHKEEDEIKVIVEWLKQPHTPKE